MKKLLFIKLMMIFALTSHAEIDLEELRRECGRYEPIIRDGRTVGGNTVLDSSCVARLAESDLEDQAEAPDQSDAPLLDEKSQRQYLLSECGRFKPIVRNGRRVGGTTVIDPACAHELLNE